MYDADKCDNHESCSHIMNFAAVQVYVHVLIMPIGEAIQVFIYCFVPPLVLFPLSVIVLIKLFILFFYL